MRLGERIVKAAAGLIVLFVLFLMVSNWVGDYRAAGKDQAGSASKESTASPEPTETAEPAAEGEEAAGQSTPPAAGKTVTVLVDGLNFRSAASRDAELIRGLDANERLELLGEEDGWLKVRDADGETGYVSASGSYTRIE